jgi:hypothetical protein
LNIHTGDPEKTKLIQEALEDGNIDRQEAIPKSERKERHASMTKKEAIAT